MNQKGTSSTVIILIVVGIFVVVGGGYWYFVQNRPVACTQEAKQCPDGSAVGRTGPNCEFAACPEAKADETADWKTYRNEKYGFEIGYPLNFVIHQESDWVNSFFVSFGRLNMSSVYSIYIEKSKYSNIEDLLKYEIKLEKPIDKRGAYVEDVVENIKISDKPALKITRTSLFFLTDRFPPEPTKSMRQTVFVINNNYLYEIRLTSSEDILFNNQILSTFKFTK